jgi:acyl-coenzyme A thioesterase PaaI-like protein
MRGGDPVTDGQAFQDAFSENHCWGCGPLNPHGLQIKSYWSGEEAICTWQPQPYHTSGPPHILNGGIIAVLMDCHCVCTAVAAAYRAEGRSLSSQPRLLYVTASLQVTYLRPTPIAAPVVIRAHITSTTGKKTLLACSLHSEGDECARGELVAVRVPSTAYAAPA